MPMRIDAYNTFTTDGYGDLILQPILMILNKIERKAWFLDGQECGS